MLKVLAAGAAACHLLGAGACGALNSGSGLILKQQPLPYGLLRGRSGQEGFPGCKLWKRIEKEHPEYKITWKNSVVILQMQQPLLSKIQRQQQAVYQFASDQLGALVDAQAIGELSDDATKQVKKQNDETLVNSVTGTDGKALWCSTRGNTWFMYYNKVQVQCGRY